MAKQFFFALEKVSSFFSKENFVKKTLHAGGATNYNRCTVQRSILPAIDAFQARGDVRATPTLTFTQSMHQILLQVSLPFSKEQPGGRITHF